MRRKYQASGNRRQARNVTLFCPYVPLLSSRSRKAGEGSAVFLRAPEKKQTADPSLRSQSVKKIPNPFTAEYAEDAEEIYVHCFSGPAIFCVWPTDFVLVACGLRLAACDLQPVTCDLFLACSLLLVACCFSQPRPQQTDHVVCGNHSGEHSCFIHHGKGE